MICYLIRHGQDDDTLRGGWSSAPLTETGTAQAQRLAEHLAATHPEIDRLYSSDLLRARQTAESISEKLMLPITFLPQFREVNNGLLAGMKNEDAAVLYPGLFWNTLEWDECYPDGESPHLFFQRITGGRKEFIQLNRDCHGTIALVSHGGVINVILHLLENKPYSNRNKPFPVAPAEYISIEI